ILVISISILGGVILGLAVGHLRDLADRVFRTRDQVERRLALDCLAIVPRMKVGKLKSDRSRVQSGKDDVAILNLPPAPNLTADPSTNSSGDNDGTEGVSGSADGGADRISDIENNGVGGQVANGGKEGAETSDARVIGRRDKLMWQVM